MKDHMSIPDFYKRLRAGRVAVGKQPVVGMKERGGPIRAMPVRCTDKPTIRAHIEAGSTLYPEHKA